MTTTQSGFESRLCTGFAGLCGAADGTTRAAYPGASGWGQAPALRLCFDPRLSLFGRRWLVSPAGAGIHPGSEFGTCFRTDDSLNEGLREPS